MAAVHVPPRLTAPGAGAASPPVSSAGAAAGASPGAPQAAQQLARGLDAALGPAELLPLEGRANVWGDEIYFDIPLNIALEADARAGVKNITPSLVEMTKSFQADFWQAFTKVYVWAAMPEILAGIRLGCIRSIKGVIIGQLLVSVVGFGRLFELYSANFLMEHMWALLFVLFFFAFLIAEGLGVLERKFEYYAASRN